MKDLKFTNGDLVIENGDAQTVKDDDELQQVVTEILSVFRGEWYFNEEHGTNYFSFLGEKFDEEVVTSVMLDALSQEPRIESVENIRFEREGRLLLVHITINGMEVSVDAIN